MDLSSLSPPIHSCYFCQRFVLGPPRKSEDEELWFAGPPGSRVRRWIEEAERRGAKVPLNMIIFDATLPEIENAAKTGCAFCEWIVGERFDEEYERRVGGWPAEEWPAEKWPAEKWPAEECFVEEWVEECLLVAKMTSECHAEFGIVSLKDLENYLEIRLISTWSSGRHLSLLRGMVDPETGAWYMNVLPGSDFSSKLISKWFHTCKSSHKTCHEYQTKYRPTRLLKIERQQGHRILRLCERSSTADVVSYAALSYCWGQNQNLKTTTMTIRSHLVEISFTDLPLTIQHAVMVTEVLGLCYLWVDALCIIQDDENDKSWEIAQMPGVYMGASVTIMASRASEVREGFLQERDCRNKNKIGCELPFPYKEGIGGTVIAHDRVLYAAKDPLSSRAWALQEQWLSSKRINFGGTETSWTCREAYEDDMPVQLRRDSIDSQEYRWEFFWLLRSPETLERESEMWHRVLCEYTRCHLTLSSDRLPAISGIAEQFSHRLGDGAYYAAGLWSSTLLHDLMWYDASGLQQRPTEYQGPSWSWASINGAVRFHYESDIDPRTTVISCNVELANKGASGIDTRFGAVKSGRLEIEGPLRRFQLLHGSPTSGYSNLYVRDAANEEIVLNVWWHPDATDDFWFETGSSPKGEAVILYTLLIATAVKGWRNKKEIYSLVLKKDDATGYFSRWGLTYTWHPGTSFDVDNDEIDKVLSWLEDGEIQRIVIV
ncbi:hypothetical protein FKW77_008749 [Venturia effusa]|uniref:Heterokaryon incompatibility domain-containing protein n=1 Tax=Venturia effusa TaxID=50376 RepID=A0A517LBH6_9PEZI|nr:hypothetical protein FKW77_008749 [Venturia effusa]